MRINALTIKHLASHKDTTVDLTGAPVSVFFGLNGAGKTPTARAVELLLRGGVAAYEGSRAHPLRRFVRRGEDGGEVQGQLVRAAGDKPVTILRRLTGKGVETRVDDKATEKAAFDFYLPPGVRQPDAVLRVLAQTDSFFELDDAVQKALLGALVDQAVPEEALKDLPLARLTTKVTTLDTLGAAYDEAYNARKTAKARLAGLRAAPDPGTTDKVDLTVIEERLQDLRTEERAIIAGSSTSQGARRTLDEERERVERARTEAQTALDSLGTEPAAKARLEQIGAEIRKAAEAQAKRAQATGDLARLREELGRLEKNTGPAIDPALKCALVAEARCALSAAAKGAATKTRNERMTALKTEITTKEQAIGAVPDTAALEQERARLDQGQGRRGELVKAVETAKKRIEHLTKQLAETPAVSGEPDSLGALRERIRRGEASLTGSRDLNQRIDAYAAYREQASALEREVFDLEVLCDKLGPKGIREGLIGARLGALQAEVNRVLGAFGLQVEYVAEPWEVRVNASSGPGLGKAEAFRAGVAHQVALAHVTGVRFLQVDGLDILDTGNRAAFFGVLDFAVTQKLIDQALVYATYTKEPKPSSIPWAKFFLVEYAGDSTAIRPLAA